MDLSSKPTAETSLLLPHKRSHCGTFYSRLLLQARRVWLACLFGTVALIAFFDYHCVEQDGMCPVMAQELFFLAILWLFPLLFFQQLWSLCLLDPIEQRYQTDGEHIFGKVLGKCRPGRRIDSSDFVNEDCTQVVVQYQPSHGATCIKTLCLPDNCDLYLDDSTSSIWMDIFYLPNQPSSATHKHFVQPQFVYGYGRNRPLRGAIFVLSALGSLWAIWMALCSSSPTVFPAGGVLLGLGFFFGCSCFYAFAWCVHRRWDLLEGDAQINYGAAV